MPDYDFKNISPIDFESLVRDLIQEDLGLRLESFTVGRDQGVDFRFCPSVDHKIIVQCKHFSRYDALLRTLRKTEKGKIKKLNPTRYILATSLGLTPQNKQKLIDALDPFVSSAGDILGREDINNLLGMYPDIERRHFKLWISSLAVLEEVLHSRLKNLSRQALDRMRNKARCYVQNESFGKALDILNVRHVCIIAGIPGIGKTTLAEMLSLYHVDRGYELVNITADIREASDLDYEKTRRIFYYDDFLGQTSLSEKLGKNEDQSLIDFIRAIERSGVSKLILTTREYIFNQARSTHEKLYRADFAPETYILDLESYTRSNRAKILFNHVFFSTLASEYKRSLLSGRQYLKIIDHANYSPRIIESMADVRALSGIRAEGYAQAFLRNLDNPLELWRHAHENQLSSDAHDLLSVMASMPSKVSVDDLQSAFVRFRNIGGGLDVRTGATHGYRDALKELEGNFISISKEGKAHIVAFHNPSIRDYLVNFLSRNSAIIVRLIETAVFYEQLEVIWRGGDTEEVSCAIRDVIGREADAFLKSAKSTLSERGCGIAIYGLSGGLRYEHTRTPSHAERMRLLLDFGERTGHSGALKVFGHEFVAEMNGSQGWAHIENVCGLLNQLKGSKRALKVVGLDYIRDSIGVLVSEAEWLPEYEALAALSETWPDVVDSDARDLLVSAFERHIEDGEFSDDPDGLHSDAIVVKSIGKQLGMDVAAKVEELTQRALELEEEAEPVDDTSDGGSIDPGGETCSNEEIDSMFSLIDVS